MTGASTSMTVDWRRARRLWADNWTWINPLTWPSRVLWLLIRHGHL